MSFANELKKVDSKIWLVSVFILALILFNVLIFFGVFESRFCTEIRGPKNEVYNIFVCGKENPVEEIKEVILKSDHIDIVFESDADPTQKGSLIAKGIMAFSEQFAGKDLNFYGLEMQNNRAINCVGSKGANYTIEYCKNLKPAQDSALIYVKYPSGGQRSEIDLNGRTLYFKPATAIYLENMVNVVLVNVLYYA